MGLMYPFKNPKALIPQWDDVSLPVPHQSRRLQRLTIWGPNQLVLDLTDGVMGTVYQVLENKTESSYR